VIDKPYVLFTRIHLIKTQAGRLFCDVLWAKDLRLHLDYISDFRICCPVIYSNKVQGLEDITDSGIKHLFELRKDYGFGVVIRNLIPNLVGVIKACRGANIVHSDGAGWPFPLSFYLLLLRPFFSFKWVLVIESSFWMINKDEKFNLRNFISHHVHKVVLSRCLRQADARIFTQSFYRKFFLNEDISHSLIAPATWIDKNNLVSLDIVKQRHSERKGKELQLIFPARLVEDKGVFVLFDAIDYLKNMGVKVSVTIMGSGALKKDCKTFASKEFGSVNVVYREPVEYGVEFFKTLCCYDVVLVPNLKEEQPRIVFDAFSQGLGVIASDTSGILDITIDGQNAVICKRGDPKSLADSISNLVERPELVLQMGLSGLSYADGKTHLQMHLDRQRFFASVLDI
jgi:glycosyltransferase involved in cell wall biosynthesis